MATTVDPRDVWVHNPRLRSHSTTGTRWDHDWLVWCDGQAHVLTRGDDFPEEVSMPNTRSTARQWATRNGFVTTEQRFRTSVRGDDELVLCMELVPENRENFVRLVRKRVQEHPEDRAKLVRRAAEATRLGRQGDNLAAQLAAQAGKAWREALGISKADLEQEEIAVDVESKRVELLGRGPGSSPLPMGPL